MTVPWACSALHAALPFNWFWAAHVLLIVSHALSVSVPRPCDVQTSRINYYTLLFGAQQSVLGRETPCLDSPECTVLCLWSNVG